MRKKVNQKRVRQLLDKFLWLMAMLSIAALLWVSVNTHLNRNINQLYVEIENLEGSRNLISKEMAEMRIEQFFGTDIQEVKFAKIDSRKLEEALLKDSRIEQTEVYVDGNNILHVSIKQRSPVIRIMAENGEDYYLDKYGERIETVKNSAVRVPIASGYIDKYISNWREMSAHKIHDILAIAKELPKDEFLQALIEQIYVEKDGAITLIPKVGKQQLILGSSDKLNLKLRNIKLTYKSIVRIKGFDKYERFIYEYTNQIIGDNGNNSKVISS